MFPSQIYDTLRGMTQACITRHRMYAYERLRLIQYHAEGLYKDRSAFIYRHSSIGRASVREGIEHLNTP